MSRKRQDDHLAKLSRRERQIMTLLYRLEHASAAEIREALPDPPTYTAVRTHLSLLEGKGQVRHTTEAGRYIYSPVITKKAMTQNMVAGLLKNFFGNSIEQAVTAFVKHKEAQLTDEELTRLEGLIKAARKEGR